MVSYLVGRGEQHSELIVDSVDQRLQCFVRVAELPNAEVYSHPRWRNECSRRGSSNRGSKAQTVGS